jgi:hypothetical protein
VIAPQKIVDGYVAERGCELNAAVDLSKAIEMSQPEG